MRQCPIYTQRVTGTDPGPDGVAGTGDDGSAFTVWDIPAGVAVPPSRTQYRTPDEADADYTSLDITVTKRMANDWSLVASFMETWNHDSLFGQPQNPNEDIYNFYRTTDRTFKLFASYRAPYDIVVAPILRYQAGDPLRRVVQVTSLRVGTFNYTAEPFGKYREDDVLLFDTRLEKRFALPGKRSVGLFVDAFNIFNTNAAQAQDTVTGVRTATLPGGEVVTYQRFMRPTTIIPPRVYRFGLQLQFWPLELPCGFEPFCCCSPRRRRPPSPRHRHRCRPPAASPEISR